MDIIPSRTREIKAHRHAIEVCGRDFVGITKGKWHDGDGFHLRCRQTIGKPTAIKLHGDFLIQKLARHGRFGRCGGIGGKSAHIIEFAKQIHGIKPALRNFFHRLRARLIIFQTARGKHAKFNQIMRYIRQAHRYGDDAVACKRFNGEHEGIPIGGQGKIELFKEWNVAKQGFPIRTDGDGVHNAVWFHHEGIFGKIQGRIRFVDFADGDDVVQNDGTISGIGKEEKHIGFIACCKIFEDTSFPIFVRCFGVVNDDVARFLLPCFEDGSIGIGGHIVARKGANCVQSNALCMGKNRANKSQQDQKYEKMF